MYSTGNRPSLEHSTFYEFSLRNPGIGKNSNNMPPKSMLFPFVVPDWQFQLVSCLNEYGSHLNVCSDIEQMDAGPPFRNTNSPNSTLSILVAYIHA